MRLFSYIFNPFFSFKNIDFRILGRIYEVGKDAARTWFDLVRYLKYFIVVIKTFSRFETVLTPEVGSSSDVGTLPTMELSGKLLRRLPKLLLGFWRKYGS